MSYSFLNIIKKSFRKLKKNYFLECGTGVHVTDSNRVMVWGIVDLWAQCGLTNYWNLITKNTSSSTSFWITGKLHQKLIYLELINFRIWIFYLKFPFNLVQFICTIYYSSHFKIIINQTLSIIICEYIN